MTLKRTTLCRSHTLAEVPGNGSSLEKCACVPPISRSCSSSVALSLFRTHGDCRQCGSMWYAATPAHFHRGFSLRSNQSTPAVRLLNPSLWSRSRDMRDGCCIRVVLCGEKSSFSGFCFYCWAKRCCPRNFVQIFLSEPSCLNHVSLGNSFARRSCARPDRPELRTQMSHGCTQRDTSAPRCPTSGLTC